MSENKLKKIKDDLFEKYTNQKIKKTKKVIKKNQKEPVSIIEPVIPDSIDILGNSENKPIRINRNIRRNVILFILFIFCLNILSMIKSPFRLLQV